VFRNLYASICRTSVLQYPPTPRHKYCNIRYSNHINLLQPILALGLILCSSTACNDTPSGPRLQDPTNVFWRLTLNHHAVTLSDSPPYDTLQLMVTPFDPFGNVIETDAPVYFTSVGNDTSVLVDESGLLNATTSNYGNGVWIRATMTINGVTLSDSVHVLVTDVSSLQVLASLSIQPPPNDSLIRGCGTGSVTLTPELLDTSGISFSQFHVFYSSEDSSIVRIDPFEGVVTVSCVEEAKAVTLYAETTIYGIRKRDSVKFIAIPPVYAIVTVSQGTSLSDNTVRSQFIPGKLVVSQGAAVQWDYSKPDVIEPVAITFDHPEMVHAADTVIVGVLPTGNGGNIEPNSVDPIPVPCDILCFIMEVQKRRRIRVFPIPGTYTYTGSNGGTGVIIVRARSLE
jgi:hypothetical protein